MRIVAETTVATVDLRVGGTFSSRMETKDGSMGFDFGGTYTRIERLRSIESAFGDHVLLVEQQRQGWQAILDTFGKHVEAKKRAMTG